MSTEISVHLEKWKPVSPFRTATGVWNEISTTLVELRRDGVLGRGEARGVSYRQETPETVAAGIEQLAVDVVDVGSRHELIEMLSPGGVRNAIDCAMWDLESKRAGRRAWEYAGLDLKQIVTAYSIGLESRPSAMGKRAAAVPEQPVLKVKLDSDRPVERIESIRDARPDAVIIVDVNQGWSIDQLRDVVPYMQRLGVTMIEQPLPRGADGELEGFDSLVPLCADESCLHGGEIEQASRRYQMINIKLDKCGGLTHGLEMAREARMRGLGVMVGCMGGTSLAMAPAFALGLVCDYHDLDGPLLLEKDRASGLEFSQGHIKPPSAQLWG